MSPAKDGELLSAVVAGDVEAARQWLDAGANPNVRDPDKLTALMLAAGRANAALVRLLLDREADALAVEPRAGSSVLHVACQGGSADIVQMMLGAGASVNSVCAMTGHTPLMDAFWYKWPQIVKVLLDNGAGLNLRTHYGFTLAQHVAFEKLVNFFGKDRFDQAENFLDERRKADEKSAAGHILMAAVVGDNVEAVQALLAAGFEVDKRYPIVNGFNDGHTPLLVACREGHVEIAETLIKAGADVNAVEPTFGAVPLHKAVYSGHVEITRLLVEQPAIKLNYRGATNGYTPLHDALWHGHKPCAEVLLDKKADISLCGNDGKRPADIAREVFSPEDSIHDRLRA
jgi:ankyrin repeat protein